MDVDRSAVFTRGLKSMGVIQGALCFSLLGLVASSNPTVTLPNGVVEGVTLPMKGFQDPLVFYAVPYAQPPLAALRFQGPQPLTAWEGVRDATRPGPLCSQAPIDARMINFLGLSPYNEWTYSEDCLTLDVYTKSLTGKRPVMVYIHGGALQSGASSVLYDYRAYAAAKDIVMVSMQYRVGALGWASMNDDVLPGNLGFQDQVQAMKWVQENIHLFGGDPDQVTLFGESAGSWCVTMHMLSPKSEGLFKRAIAQSGSVINTGIAPPLSQNKDLTVQLADCIGCPSDDSSLMLDCFMKQPAENFTPSEDRKCLRGLLHGPVVDGTWMPDLPERLLKNGQFNRNIDVIMGSMLTEGYFLTALTMPALVSPDMTVEKLEAFISSDIDHRFPSISEYVREAATKEALRTYLRSTTHEGLSEAVTSFFGDSLLLWPCFSFALGLREVLNGKVFFYEMRHRPSISNRPAFVRTDHCDDLIFMQGNHLTDLVGLFPVTLTDEDKAVARDVFNAWTNFALHGDPNGESDTPYWPPMDADTNAYMAFDAQSHVEVHYQQLRVKFWRDTLPELTQKTTASVVQG